MESAGLEKSSRVHIGVCPNTSESEVDGDGAVESEMNRLLSKTVDESAESKAAIDTLHCSTFISLQEENFIRQVFSDITQFSRHSNFSGNHCVVVFVSLLRAQGDGRFSLQVLFILTK